MVVKLQFQKQSSNITSQLFYKVLQQQTSYLYGLIAGYIAIDRAE